MRIAGYEVSRHLQGYLRSQRSYIKPEWIEAVINDPEHFEYVSEDEIRLWKQIPDFGNRFLRVVVNPKNKAIVTAFFDRRFRR